MQHKAKKKLIKQVLEVQKAAPKPVLPAKNYPVTKLLQDFNKIPVYKIAVMLTDGPDEKPMQEKFRGYKIKQANPFAIVPGMPSRLF